MEKEPGIWGVAIDYRNGKHAAYEVGTRAEADMECRRLDHGDRPLFGPLMAGTCSRRTRG
jgi:hypothetical protein